jgi:hypothetical protein
LTVRQPRALITLFGAEELSQVLEQRDDGSEAGVVAAHVREQSRDHAVGVAVKYGLEQAVLTPKLPGEARAVEPGALLELRSGLVDDPPR